MILLAPQLDDPQTRSQVVKDMEWILFSGSSRGQRSKKAQHPFPEGWMLWHLNTQGKDHWALAHGPLVPLRWKCFHSNVTCIHLVS